nr:10358_t:CDS:2 [Entrophospora candida]
MHELCDKLDDVLLEYFSFISNYQEQWKQINTELENGFLQLAHAKYTMGSGRITQNQYDERMKASTRVLISKVETAVTDTSNLINSSNEHNYTLINYDKFSEDDVDDSDKIIIKNTTSSTLRQRSLKSTNKEEMEDSGIKKSSKIKVNKNPLNWFGILVPSTLRDTQKHFKQALVSMVMIINIHNKILEKENEYKHLKQQKALRINQILESDKKETNDESISS